MSQATSKAPSVAAVAPGLPPALSAAIDRRLARDPDEPLNDAEKLADALVPATETRPALPPTLRAWLSAKNPLVVPYTVWTAGFSVVTLGNLMANLTGNPGSSPWDVMLALTATSLPLFPIVGFHLNHAWRQFSRGAHARRFARRDRRRAARARRSRRAHP